MGHGHEDEGLPPAKRAKVEAEAGEVRRLPYTYDEIAAISAFVLSRTKYRPTVGIVCGSGLGGLADELTERETLDYAAIPNFPVSTVAGHAGRFVFGLLSGQPTVAMQGRFHFYEGYPLWKVTLPIRVMHLLGVRTLIVTNAAGGLNQAWRVGDIMTIEDHISLPGMAGNNPLVGPNEERFGPRFPPTSQAYPKDLRQAAAEVAASLGLGQYMRSGVYVCVSGPSFETPAEARYLRSIGADAVGMSTAPEVIVAVHCGMRVLGLSLITNHVVQDVASSEVASHLEVLETSRVRAADMQRLVTAIVARIAPSASA